MPGVYFLEIDGLAHDVLRRAIRDGNAPNLARWLHDGSHRLMPLGDRLVVADGRLPGRPPARRQRRHPGLPLVGEGPRQRDRDQPPARCRRDRAPPLERARPAARGRREPGEHRLRRRRPHAAHDEHGPRPRPPRADRPGLLRLLRQPVQRHAHDRARDRRHRAGAPLRRPAAPPRRPPADPARPQVRAGAGVGHGRPDRPPGAGGDRGPVRRAARWATRRSSPTTRSPTIRASSAADALAVLRARRPPDRPHRRRRARTRARPYRFVDPLRPRPVAGRDVPRPLRRSRSRTWCRRPARPRTSRSSTRTPTRRSAT